THTITARNEGIRQRLSPLGGMTRLEYGHAGRRHGKRAVYGRGHAKSTREEPPGQTGGRVLLSGSAVNPSTPPSRLPRPSPSGGPRSRTGPPRAGRGRWRALGPRPPAAWRNTCRPQHWPGFGPGPWTRFGRPARGG